MALAYRFSDYILVDFCREFELELSRSNMEFLFAQPGMVWLPRNEKQTCRLKSRPQMWPSCWPWPWPWPWIFKVKCEISYISAKINESNRYLCFPFRGNHTILGWEITNSIFDFMLHILAPCGTIRRWLIFSSFRDQTLLSMCLSNFKGMRWFKPPISRLGNFARCYDKTSYRILKRGPGRYWFVLPICRECIFKHHTFFYCFTYILMPHNIIILYFRLPYFHVPHSALISTTYFSTLISHRRSLDASYLEVYITRRRDTTHRDEKWM